MDNASFLDFSMSFTLDHPMINRVIVEISGPRHADGVLRLFRVLMVAAKALEAILERRATHRTEKPGLNPVKQDRSKPSLTD